MALTSCAAVCIRLAAVNDSSSGRLGPKMTTFTRPAYHEMGASLSLPLYWKNLELTATYSLAIGKTIPIDQLGQRRAPGSGLWIP